MFRKKTIEFNNVGNLNACEIGLNNITVFVGENNSSKTYLFNTIYYLHSSAIEKIISNTVKEALENRFPKWSNKTETIETIGLIIDKLSEINLFKQAYNLTTQITKNVSIFNDSTIRVIVDKSVKEELYNVRDEIVFEYYKHNKDAKKVLDMLASIVQLKQPERRTLASKAQTESEVFKILFEALYKDPKSRLLGRYTALINSLFKTNGYVFPVERAGMNIFYHDVVNRNVTMSLESYSEFLKQMRIDCENELLIDGEFYKIAEELEEKLFHGKLFVEKVDQSSNIFFQYGNTDDKLPLILSSSSVNELSTLILYLKHYAQKGDMVFIDEPEISLHPEAQRILVRYIAKLSNLGLKFTIITHSDYIVRELNHLVTLGNLHSKLKELECKELTKENMQNIAKEYGLEHYCCDTFIVSSDILLYSFSHDEKDYRVNVTNTECGYYGFEEKLFSLAINRTNSDSNSIFKMVNAINNKCLKR